jgi:WD40 repeat protein
MITSDNIGNIRIFDVNSKKLIMKWEAHKGIINDIWYSNDETTIFSVGEDAKIKQWSAHLKGKLIHSYYIPNIENFKNPKIFLSNDSKYILLNSPAKIFEIEKSNTPILSLENLQRKQVFFNSSVSWSQKNLIAGSFNNELTIFHFDGLLKKSIECDEDDENNYIFKNNEKFNNTIENNEKIHVKTEKNESVDNKNNEKINHVNTDENINVDSKIIENNEE